MNNAQKTINIRKALLLSAFFLFWGSLALPTKAETLAEHLSGRIVLQVEQNGEAWFVDPVSKQRYYMGRPMDAFTLMRFLGLGVTDADLAKVPINGTTWDGPTRLMNHVQGRILLQVEQNGEAWHISPVNQRRYYMGRPADAFQLMRNLGLGITDTNLESIPIHPDSASPTSNENRDNNNPTNQDDGEHGNDNDGNNDNEDRNENDDDDEDTNQNQNDESLYPSIANIDYDAFPENPNNTHDPSGTTYYVATTGDDNNNGTSLHSPLRSLGEAEDRVSSGDMVVIRAGDYQHCLNSAPGCYILDLNTNSVIWTNYESEDVNIVTSPSYASWGVGINGDNIIIDGIDIVGFNGISVNLVGDTTVLKNMTIDTNTSGYSGGIKANNAHNKLLVKSVTIKDAMLAIGSDNDAVTNWRIDDTLIQNYDSGAGSGGDAIGIENGSNFLFTNITATGASGDGIDIKGSNAAVFNVHAHNNARNGIKFWQGGDLVNSLVHDNAADAAVVFDDAGTYRILNSVIAWHNRESGGSSYSMTVGYDNPSKTINMSLINSAICGNTGGVFYSSGTNLTRTTSIEQSTTSCESFGFKNDLTFDSGTQMENSGTNVSNMPPYDFSGNDRTQGSSPDIGAFELF